MVTVQLARHADHPLLQRGHRSVADLHREVAARDHDPIGGLEDLVEVADRLVALDLGDHQHAPARRAHQLAGHVHVARIAREGDREEVRLQRHRVPDVLEVLGSEGRRRQPAPLPVDALAVREHPAGQHRGFDRLRAHAHDAHGDASVVEQQRVARLHVVHQLGVVEPDAALVAQREARVEDEGIARGELDPAVLEAADADLRALQVGQNADVAPQPRCDLAHLARRLCVLLGAAVREIEPHDVDAGDDHPLENRGVRARGPESGDDLGGAG